LRGYEVGWLQHDIVAGLVLTTMLVPVGIAYAVASGVSGIYGLYATIIPLLAYALFGPSRILVLGPDSALVAVILAVVLQQSGGDPLRAIALADASLGGIAQRLLTLSMLDLPLDEPARAARVYHDMTAAQVQDAYKKWLRPGDMVQVIQGPPL